MRWSILTISHPARARQLDRLQRVLARQIGDLPVEHVVYQDVGDVGELRQTCLELARGEYVNFVDDDDRVPPDYVPTIFPILDGVDYIGHRVQLYVDGTPDKPTTHSLRYRGWSEDEHGYYRGVSHLNPLRADLARRVRFRGGFEEDRRWAEQVEEWVRPQTEHFVDKVLYLYFYSRIRTLTRGNDG